MTQNEIPASGFYNADSLAEMKKFPDGFFDFAIVDPPYGTPDNAEFFSRGNGRFCGRFERYTLENIRREQGAHCVPRGRGKKYAEILNNENPPHLHNFLISNEPEEHGRKNTGKKS